MLNHCEFAVVAELVDRKKDVSLAPKWFREYDTPSMKFLMEAFGVGGGDTKDKRFTNTDWSGPLSEGQKAYAAKDSYYLLDIFHCLYKRVCVQACFPLLGEEIFR